MSRDGVTPPHWFVREAIQAFDLKPYASLVFFGLCDHAHPGTRIAFPSHRLLALELGIARESVRRGLDRLIEVGLIEYAEPPKPKRTPRYLIPRQMPWPAPSIPLPTRRAEHDGDAWRALESGLPGRPDEAPDEVESGLPVLPDGASIWPTEQAISSTSAPGRTAPAPRLRRYAVVCRGASPLAIARRTA